MTIYFDDDAIITEQAVLSKCDNNKTLITEVIRNNVPVEIDQHAFDGCINLETFYFNKNITKIGNYGFNGCTSYPKFADEFEQLSSIGDYAFASCYNFPAKIKLSACTEIGRYAFLSCQNLSNLNAPNCTFVDYNAFYGTKLWDVDPAQQ